MTATLRRPLLIAVAVVAGLLLAALLTGRTAASDAPLGDGMVVQVDDGLIYFLWDGGKQRIQQPAAYSDADLAELGLEIGAEAPARLTLGEEGTFFAMYPFDGPQAALYLVADGVMHRVQVSAVTLDDLTDRPDLSELVITRVRVPEVSTQ